MTDQIFGKQIAFLASGCILCCLVANTKYLRIVIFASVQNKVEPDDSHLRSPNSSFLLSLKQAVRRAKGVHKRSQTLPPSVVARHFLSPGICWALAPGIFWLPAPVGARYLLVPGIRCHPVSVGIKYLWARSICWRMASVSARPMLSTGICWRPISVVRLAFVGARLLWARSTYLLSPRYLLAPSLYWRPASVRPGICWHPASVGARHQ